MSRDSQVAGNAPNRGTMLRKSHTGVAAFLVPALERFPPPDFLTDTQKNLWVAALADIPLEFFRARHIPLMIQYVRAVEHMMTLSDEFESDPEDMVLLNRWERMIKIATTLERRLAFDAVRLSGQVIRARSEQRVALQKNKADEAGVLDKMVREGLVYVGH